MSRIIALTPDMIEKMKSEFGEQLGKNRFITGEIRYIKSFEEDKNDKAVLYFTLKAWSKMTALLREFNKEVAWHGVAHRVEGEDNAYKISDIMVYPQTVSPTSVDMDEVAYTKWIIEHDGEEPFDHLRFQGHSHVNMTTSPSSTDMHHQEEILAQLEPDDFYIFAIYNKSLSRDIKIYDMKKNRVYSTADVTVKIDWGFDMEGFMEESKSMVVEKAYSGYDGSYSGFHGDSSYQGAGGDTRPVTPAVSQDKALATTGAKGANKPVSKPGDTGWNVDGLTDEDDSPYPAQK